jgi:hypothetical protein
MRKHTSAPIEKDTLITTLRAAVPATEVAR